MKTPKFWQQIAAIVGMVVGLMVQVDANASPTTQPPAGFQPKKPNYVTAKQSDAPAIAAVGAVIRVYQDFFPWFGEGRDQATLLALGKILGVDYFIHPVSDLSAGIPADTAVVLITSNSFGSPETAAAQNDPTAQANLDAFVQAGGTLIVDMGDNLDPGGFIAPGAVGTPDLPPDLIFPDPCEDATLALAALGPDGILGTADDHPIVKGSDGIPGTGDDLNDSNIDMGFCGASASVAHGNLADGITLPDGATVLTTATFGGVQKPILAEYPYGSGRVILDTLTKEFGGHQPSFSKCNELGCFGPGASFFLRNLLHQVLNDDFDNATAITTPLPFVDEISTLFAGTAADDPDPDPEL
jgi:hypothetical protein